jgi:hypothetical protein
MAYVLTSSKDEPLNLLKKNKFGIVSSVIMVIDSNVPLKDFLKSYFAGTKKLNLTSQEQKLAVQTIIFDALIFSIMTKDCT